MSVAPRARVTDLRRFESELLGEPEISGCRRWRLADSLRALPAAAMALLERGSTLTGHVAASLDP